MYENLEQMIDHSKKLDAKKLDIDCSLSDLDFSNHSINVNSEGSYPIHQEKFMRQIFGLLRDEKIDWSGSKTGIDKQPIRYTNQFWDFYKSPTKGVGESIESLLNSLKEVVGDKEIKLRLFDNKPRAILSGHYQDFPNTKLLEHLLSLTNKGNLKDYYLPRSYVNENDLIVNLVSKAQYGVKENGITKPYSGGYGIQNNETGEIAFKSSGILQRISCQNSIRFNQASKLIHKGNKVWQILNLISGEIGSAFADIGNWFDGIELLSTMEIDLQAEIDKLGERFPLLIDIPKKKESIAKEMILLGSENSHTELGLINGITWYAQQKFEKEPNLSYDLETLAGNLFKQALEEKVELEK